MLIIAGRKVREFAFNGLSTLSAASGRWFLLYSLSDSLSDVAAETAHVLAHVCDIDGWDASVFHNDSALNHSGGDVMSAGGIHQDGVFRSRFHLVA